MPKRIKYKVIANVNGKDIIYNTSGYLEDEAIRLIFTQLSYNLSKEEFKNGMTVKFSLESLEESESLDEDKG